MQDKEIIDKINKVLDKIRPYINSEGGDLEFISYENGVVNVRLLGACAECGMIDSTLKDGIESLLIENVPEVIEVRNITSQDNF